MKKTIDHLTDITGWTLNSPSVVSVNDHIIAGLNDSSIMLYFSSSDSSHVATKMITSIDSTEYETLVLSIWSRGQHGNQFLKSSDFNYKIKINDTQEFYLPIYSSFTNVNIAIDDVDSIDRIEITALHDQDDYIVISEMVIEHEELPLDILLGIKENLEFTVNKYLGNGIKVATLNGQYGDKEVTFDGDKFFIDHYTAVTITDGVNTETHQLTDGNGSTFQFMSSYDGKSLLNNYINADVYVSFPININPDENDITLPSFTLWGIDPEPIFHTGKLDIFIRGFSVDADNFVAQREGQILGHKILIDCASRQSELIDNMSRMVRKLMLGNVIWINGRKHEVNFTETPVDVRPPTGINVIPKLQYIMEVQSIENFADRETLEKVSNTNITVNVED